MSEYREPQVRKESSYAKAITNSYTAIQIVFEQDLTKCFFKILTKRLNCEMTEMLDDL